MGIELLFGSRTRAGLLSLLLAEPERQLGVREAARLLGVSPNSVQREMVNLLKGQILLDERVGTSRLLRANQDHFLFPELRALLLKSSGVSEALRRALEGLPDVDFAFIYGSLASGTDDAMSDVDLMVIGPKLPRAIYAVAREVQEMSKRPVRPSVFTAQEVGKRLRAGDAFMLNVMRGPKIILIGDADGLERVRAKGIDSSCSS